MSVTNIQQAKWQRHADEQELKSLDAKVEDAEKALNLLKKRRGELENKLFINKPDNDPEAA
ncbi:hypothetical protein [Enterobacter asburiae]|uniref:hypothetical protein n=1 Tax=Enterobacter asburiae TaxID=61645 RepID=UPI00192AFB26|nr:hypothetical protein [Enterobacter asburiae]MBL5927838.1 hypothetical protein [Enterobacter asburiae]MBL5958625.1 hypothetical protein [Enterobacter asburiae]